MSATPAPNPSLVGAIASLRTGTALLSSSLDILSRGTADLPRLQRVLAQTRHFELLPSSTLSEAQEALHSELAPEVASLLSRVERYVEKLERREEGLKARWALNEGRLGREVDESAMQNKREDEEVRAEKGKAVGMRDELKAKQLRQKKERLSYAVDRLQMQAQQAERKLRMSMAQQERKGDELGEDEDDELD